MDSDRGGLLISAARPTDLQRRLAPAILLALVLGLTPVVPVARIPLVGTETFLPAYAAAVLVVELVTAVLLYALFVAQRGLAVLVLATGYLLTGLLVIPWALSFPGVFDALGIDMGLQSTAAIASLRRFAFPVAVIWYALIKDRTGPLPWSEPSAAALVAAVIIATLVLVGLITVVTTLGGHALPPLMRDARHVAALWSAVPATVLALYGVALLLLWRRGCSVLDLWLMVVVAILAIEIIFLSYVSGGIRLSIGWWVGRVLGLISASTVLVVLLTETTMLYARLARSVAAERRIREARISAMEALSATIAHEVSQPVAGMITNANAGLRWLDQGSVGQAEARAALERIVRDGHRAGEVVAGVRAMFQPGTRAREALDLNACIRDAMERCREEAKAHRVTVQFDLADGLVPVTGNQVQLEQVVSNLAMNAIEAMREQPAPGRRLSIRSRMVQDDMVQVAVEDTGPGLPAGQAEQSFLAFHTTKPDGMGMGLMFCRFVVECHGGRLWVERAEGDGARFLFTLPRFQEEASLPQEEGA